VLANFIARAEADIDAYMGFELSLGGFEPHFAWYQEAWNQQTLKTRIPNTPVPVRQVTRYRIQVSNVSTAGAGFFANINTGDVTLNIFGGYVEIVPLQAVTYAMTPVLVALGLNPPVVQMDYEVGYNLAAFGDTLYDTGDHVNFRALRGFWATGYTVALSIQPFLLPPSTPVIYVNGAPVGSYTINYAEGLVTFNSMTTGTVTADYQYVIPDPVRAATIAQTSYLIGQADLNALGMQGILLARNNTQELRRDSITHDNAFSIQHSGMSRTASNLLDQYRAIPIG